MRRPFRLALIVATLLYAAVLVRYTCFAAGGADSSGYLNAARLVGQGKLFVRVAPLDRLGLSNGEAWRSAFIPLGFAFAPSPRDMAPSYPLGYPLHLLLLGALFGWKRAPFLVTPLMAILTLMVTYRLGRQLGLDRRWSAATAALLAIAPSFLFMAIQPMSDVTATFWCTAAILFALRAGRNPRYAAACGAAFAIAVWVRPTNLLLALAIGIALVFGVEPGASAPKQRWRSLGIAVAAAVPFALALMAVNHTLYGSALKTGYGSFRDLVSLSFIPTHLPNYSKWLATLETPLVFPGALLIAFHRRVPGWRRALLLVWIASFLGFYICYVVADAWWYTRFLLPAFPALLIATMLLLREIPGRWAWLLVALIAAQSLRMAKRYDVRDMHNSEAVYAYASRWAEKKLPPNALPVSMQLSGSLYFYDHRFSARYDELTPDRFQELRAYAGNAGLQWYAVVYDWEVPQLEKNLPGTWTKVDSNRNVLLLRLE